MDILHFKVIVSLAVELGVAGNESLRHILTFLPADHDCQTFANCLEPDQTTIYLAV